MQVWFCPVEGSTYVKVWTALSGIVVRLESPGNDVSRGHDGKQNQSTTHVNAVVPRPSRKVLPKRMPAALRELKVRTVITAVPPSTPNHDCPGPSSPVGQRMLRISRKSGSDEEGLGSTSTLSRGTGTSDEENGEAPEENGTLGLFVPLILPPWKLVAKDPANNRLDWDEFEDIESTRPLLFADSPPNGGADQEEDAGFQTATNDDGDENSPPTQTLLLLISQYTERMTPLGPPEPRADILPEEGVYDAIC